MIYIRDILPNHGYGFKREKLEVLGKFCKTHTIVIYECLKQKKHLQHFPLKNLQIFQYPGLSKMFILNRARNHYDRLVHGLVSVRRTHTFVHCNKTRIYTIYIINLTSDVSVCDWWWNVWQFLLRLLLGRCKIVD